jgi:uncharacterized damage-inducible protein DinB
MVNRAEKLAQRVEQVHRDLITLIESLSEKDWHTKIPGDTRTVGVVLHHMASVLPVETQLFQTLAAGKAIQGVTLQAVAEMNAQHAAEFASCTPAETLALLKDNSVRACAAIRSLSDAELDQAAPVSLHWNAPLTAQYFIEDHPLCHSYHHLTIIHEVLGQADMV